MYKVQLRLGGLRTLLAPAAQRECTHPALCMGILRPQHRARPVGNHMKMKMCEETTILQSINFALYLNVHEFNSRMVGVWHVEEVADFVHEAELLDVGSFPLLVLLFQLDSAPVCDQVEHAQIGRASCRERVCQYV